MATDDVLEKDYNTEDIPLPLGKEPPKYVPGKLFDYTESFLAELKKYSVTSKGQVQTERVAPIYKIEDSQAYLGNLHPQAMVNLKELLYWSGFYGSDAVLPGHTSGDDKALAKAMHNANLNGQGLIDYVSALADIGRRQFAPLGEDVEIEDTPTFQLEELATKNGIDLSSEYISKASARVALGTSTLQEELSQVRDKIIAPSFPALSDEIRDGFDVSYFAAPYIQKMSSVLEIPEEFLNLDDPDIRAAMEGSGGESLSLWEFEDSLKQDDRWQYTNNAHDSIGSAVNSAISGMGLKL